MESWKLEVGSWRLEVGSIELGSQGENATQSVFVSPAAQPHEF